MRDEFKSRTVEDIARRVGYRCSNPECQRATVGSNAGHDGAINVGVAAHITAAAAGGPRFDPTLDTETRRDQLNGIWLCQDCAKLIDSDVGHFTVERLRRWKHDAQDRAFREIVAPRGGAFPKIAPPGGDMVETIVASLRPGARADLEGFKRMLGSPKHTITLNLRMLGQTSGSSFTIVNLPDAMEVLPELTIVAPPGTGKTTTLLQLGDALLASDKAIAIFIPLSEWSKESKALLTNIVGRRWFRNTSEEELIVLADYGRLTLLLDGWNELDEGSRDRFRVELKKLHRELPRLRAVISTRRQAIDVPTSGPMIEVDLLSEDQQLDIARGQSGDRGAALVDQAWRTPGVRGLVAIPLYLNALLHGVPGKTLPNTKEEVLRLFVNQHERSDEHAEALRAGLLGCHTEFLTALAVGATVTANTAISDAYARSVVSGEEQRLLAKGQIRTPPEPGAVLDVLVNHHTLARSDADGGSISFHHQQLQEWYASFEVEKLLFAVAQGDEAARQRLRVDILNERAWEEAILFACERVSRAAEAGGAAVAAAVRLSLPIDPMLAADMIYRSAPIVWDYVKEIVSTFAVRWHAPGVEDRAVRFMIMTGRADFAPIIWPLATSCNDQIQLGTLRAAPRFRPSVLGPDLPRRIADVPGKVRQILLSEIALRSGFDGLDLTTELAKSDQSAAVQMAVAEALLFRRADRHAADLLNVASEEVWAQLARKWYAEEVHDAVVAARLRTERRRQFEIETNPLTRLGLLLEGSEAEAATSQRVAEVLAAPDFPWQDQRAAWTINTAFRIYPKQVASGLIRRVAAGLEIPFHAEKLLAGLDTVDEGPLASVVLDRRTGRQTGFAAATLIGPNTVGAMIDAYLALHETLTRPGGGTDQETCDYFNDLRNRIAATRSASFIPPLLERGNVADTRKIAVVAGLLAHHGNHDARNEPVLVSDRLLQPVFAMVRRWVDTLLASPDVTHDHFGTVARAIGRLGRVELVADLKRLLDHDLARCRQARLGFPARVPNALAVSFGAPISHMLPYRTAFSDIGGDEAAHAVRGYLDDLDFGFDAAFVLKAVWDRQNSAPQPDLLKSWPDLSVVRQARATKREGMAAVSPFAAWILAAIEKLIRPGCGAEAQCLAITLGRIVVLLPHGDQSTIFASLLGLPQPVQTKWPLLAALVLAGEVISADLVLTGITAWVDEARKKPWLPHDSFWEVDHWLELLPFSDRPAETIEGIKAVSALLPTPRRTERVVAALGYAPGDEAEGVLIEMARQNLHVLQQHEWLNAMMARGTASAAIAVLDLVADGKLTTGHGSFDIWSISRPLAGLARCHPELKGELLHWYQGYNSGSSQELIERLLIELGDADCILALAQGYARSNRPFDGSLEFGIREAALHRHPAEESSGSYELRPMALTKLRKDLFAMLGGTLHEVAVAEACLTTIDELRDQYGAPDSGPRHPNIESGRPWPLAAGAPQ